ncbi:MAG: hypothetical protein K6F63_02425 [Lachnospiraceae bacterium]|nr:hypothetical protein [Lachnospiraceae bacterium]
MKKQRVKAQAAIVVALLAVALVASESRLAYGQTEFESNLTLEDDRSAESELKTVQTNAASSSMTWIVMGSLVLVAALFILANNYFYKRHERDREEKEKRRIA